MVILLQKKRDRVLACCKDRRHAKEIVHLKVGVGVPGKNLLPVRRDPPKRRVMIELSMPQHRRAMVIGGGGKVLYACGGQDGSIGPGV